MRDALPTSDQGRLQPNKNNKAEGVPHFRFPKKWGKIDGKPDPNFRPITEKELNGFSEEDWEAIKSEFNVREA